MQPLIVNDHGYILTIGIRSSTDRTAIVMPIFNDDPGLLPLGAADDAVSSVLTFIIPDLIACLAEAGNISFVQAEGMIDGRIPARNDFSPTTYVGALANPVMPSSVAGLITYYEEPADVIPGHRMRTGHNFIPAVSQAHIVGDFIDNAYGTVLKTLADHLMNGWPTSLGGGHWYRGLSAPPRTPNNTNIPRIGVNHVRNYIGTQRRRMIPHS